MVDDFRMGDEHRLMNLIQRIIARIVQMFFFVRFSNRFSQDYERSDQFKRIFISSIREIRVPLS